MSRPSIYSEALADEICDLLMEGLSLVKICERDGMPNRRTVLRWQVANEAFAAKCARAREMQADLMDDKILDVADSSTAETAAADRVKISAYQWRASKLAPKRYGDKLDVETKITADDTIAGLLARVATSGTRLIPTQTDATTENLDD